MSTETRACAELGFLHGTRWNSAAGSAPRAGRSSRASTSPTAKPACAASSRRRALRPRDPARRRLGRWGAPGRRGAGSRPASSSSSTRSWPRCSRPACRWCSRSTSCAGASTTPVFKAVLDDVYDRVRAGSSLSEAFEAHGALSRRLHGVAARRREERQPRAGHPAIRRLRQSHGERQAQDDLGADLSGHPARCSRSSSSRSSC